MAESGRLFAAGPQVRKNGRKEFRRRNPPWRQEDIMREKIFAYIKKKYKAAPEYPWGEDDGAVLRHGDNRKWFALVMNIGREKLGLAGESRVDVVNLKIDDMAFKDALIQGKGIFPAYHMNKEHWNSIILDGTVPGKEIRRMIAESYDLTRKGK